MGTFFSSLRESTRNEDDWHSSKGRFVEGHYDPSQEDVYAVRKFLIAFVPPELANIILDEAEYWPCVRCGSATPVSIAASDSPDSDSKWCYLVTPPIFRGQHEDPEGERLVKVRRIKFRFNSCDQGWGGDPELAGPYQGSWTWFEAAIYRHFDEGTMPGSEQQVADVEKDMRVAPLQSELDDAGVMLVPNTRFNSDVWQIQRNVRASNTPRNHEVVWGDDERDNEHIEGFAYREVDDETGRGKGAGFINALLPGDRIAIIVRARFPAWVNIVHSAEIEVFSSV
ncbi:hypothetical protein BDQ12DRAFT_638797, partial [Crucibulum laeve]